MQHLTSGSSSIGIHGGTGGKGGSGGVQGGGGGLGLGPSFQFLIQHPPPDSAHQLAANAAPSDPSQAEGTSSQSSAPANLAVHSAQETYCGQLLREGRGFPLFVPEPCSNLPAEWQEAGVAIGDVGRIDRTGRFDFFFNIYLLATDPINANGVPEGFVPLSRYSPADVIPNEFGPGDYVCSSRTVTRTGVDDKFQEFPGGGFVFSCRQPTGAVLTLPHGAQGEDLANLESMRRYAVEHAESWYRYVNVTRGRGLVNGNLYLITGWEKAPSWGIAYFHDVSLQSEFKLSFRPTANAADGYKYRWNGSHCHYKQDDSPPDDGTPLNHTTFIHAFAISVGERIWEKLFGNGLGICQPLDWSTVRNNSGRSLVPYGFQGSSFPWSIFTGGSAQNNADRSFVPQGPTFPLSFFTEGSAHNEGRHATASASGDGIVTDAFPILQITHPSQMIHQRILREASQARVVITHDDAWRDAFKEDGARILGQTYSELQQAIFDRFEILEEDGVAFLRAKLIPTTSKNAPTITVDEERPIHSHMASGKLVDSFTGHTSSVSSVAVSPDSARILSGSVDNTLRMEDAKTGNAVIDPFTGHRTRGRQKTGNASAPSTATAADTASPVLPKSTKAKLGNPVFVVKYYLLAYNVLSTLGWAYILVITVVHLFNLDGNSSKPATIVTRLSIFDWEALIEPAVRRSMSTYARVGATVTLVQTLALLDVVYSLLGWVRSPLQTTAIRAASRLWIVWGIVQQFDVARTSPLYASCALAWSITEVVRYSFHVCSILGFEPPGLVYLRFTMFYVLYPVGASSEAFLTYSTLPFPSGIPTLESFLGWSAPEYVRAVAFLAWWPWAYQLYIYMIAQRRRIFSSSQPRWRRTASTQRTVPAARNTGNVSAPSAATTNTASPVPLKSTKAKLGNPALVVKYYLLAYNVLSTLGWAYIVVITVVHLFNLDGHSSKPAAIVTAPSTFTRLIKSRLLALIQPVYRRSMSTYARVGATVTLVQTLALLDVVYCLLGWIQSPLQTTAIRVASRLWIVWGIVQQFDVARTSPLYASCALAWSITEVVRYSFHVCSILGFEPPGLVYLRFTMFYVLYPVGASSEAFLTYSALTPESALGWSAPEYARARWPSWCGGFRWVYDTPL
ncbi:FCP1-like proteiny domain-containing protein [Mycena sanguinolenta]|uniref:Very-long-chain (3R)-3-hydroxyacyl-CoA dehydratase n=1 Tax=Mycena sanguinolenta TaxID=230812 RepID=A0A8H6ZBR0_9AGAR|nr:FCP1-like proteiny domain-containing protein [Mycena sanguinolenta]